VRLLTPTENHRLNELIGFLGLSLAILLTLALISYSPHDTSFNVSSQSPDAREARNWIGPAGAYGADLVFQAFGYAAFLLTLCIFGLGWRWLRSQTLDSAAVKVVGYALLVLFFPALLTLWHVPDVRGVIPPGGLLGTMIAAGLHAGFNSVGAHLVAMSAFFTGLFLATPFSFTGTHAVLRGPLSKLDPIGRLKARWSEWRESTEKKRMRDRLETIKTSGRPPVPAQNLIGKEIRKAGNAKRESDEDFEERSGDKEVRKPLLIMSDPTPAAVKKGGAEPTRSEAKKSRKMN
jgi:hypothetical protein